MTRSTVVLPLAASLALALSAPARADNKPEGRIAFASSQSGSTDVWTVGVDGSGAVDLTPVPGADLWPAWSPDGQRIAFARGSGLTRRLWVMNADGTEPVAVATDLAGVNAPDWSPDGRHIAVGRFGPDFTADIWVIDADGIDPPRRLTHDADFDGFPAWSPDGVWIAFSSSREGSESIWRIRADGTGGVERMTPAEMNGGTPDWSHDGKSIAFVDNVCSTCDESDIWVLKLTDGALTQVTDTAENEMFPDWSPDDKWLVYERSDFVGGQLFPPDVFLISVAHGGATNLTASPGVLDLMPAWRPQGDGEVE